VFYYIFAIVACVVSILSIKTTEARRAISLTESRFLRVLTGFCSETVEKALFAIDVLCSSRSSLYNLIGRSWIVVSIPVHDHIC
jgi:hypothetical protein